VRGAADRGATEMGSSPGMTFPMAGQQCEETYPRARARRGGETSRPRRCSRPACVVRTSPPAGCCAPDQGDGGGHDGGCMGTW